MSDGLVASLYAHTGESEMLSLDAKRRAAEADPEQADWAGLAQAYEAQGRPAMAEKCRGRAAYYGPVSVETAQVAYA